MNRSLTDAERFEALYRAHYAAIVRFVARRIDAASAEEVVADTFATAWRRLHDVPADPLPWLYVVARNLLHGERRTAASSRAKTANAARHDRRPYPPSREADGPRLDPVPPEDLLKQTVAPPRREAEQPLQGERARKRVATGALGVIGAVAAAAAVAVAAAAGPELVRVSALTEGPRAQLSPVATRMAASLDGVEGDVGDHAHR